MAPVVALGLCLGGLAALPLLPVLALPAIMYLVACLAWGATQAIGKRDPWLVAAGPALLTMHLSWATGFVKSVLSGGRSTAPSVSPVLIAAPVREEERVG
jgi:succinoglycan biosynthesis protein ExoA